MTHWQHPRFHAYFPSGNSYPSILADILGDAIGCIGFSWVRKWAQLRPIYAHAPGMDGPDWFKLCVGCRAGLYRTRDDRFGLVRENDGPPRPVFVFN